MVCDKHMSDAVCDAIIALGLRLLSRTEATMLCDHVHIIMCL